MKLQWLVQARALVAQTARSRGWFVLAMLATTLVAALDVLTGPKVVLIGLLIVGPLIASARTSPADAMLVTLYAVGLAAYLGVPEGIFGTIDHLVRCLVVVVSGGLSTWVSGLRRQREEAAARAATQHNLARIFAESTSLADAGPRILAAIGETFGWELGTLWVLGGRVGALRCADTWQGPGAKICDFDDLGRALAFRPGVGLPGSVWATGAPAWMANVIDDSSSARARAAASAGLDGAFGFPILSGTRVLGVIEFLTQRVGKADEDLLATVATVGRQVGQFIERREAEQAVTESEARKTAMLHAALDCIVTIDHEGRVVEFNPAAEQTFGYRAADVIGKEMASLIIPPRLRDLHREGLARYMVTGEGPVLDTRFELTAMRSDGSEFPVEVTITSIQLEQSPMFTGYLRDITARKRTETENAKLLEREHASRLRAERAEERASFLAHAVTLLSMSLDYEQTLESVARIVVPDLADWCVIDMLEEGGLIKRLAVTHVDPAKEALAWDLDRRYPLNPDEPEGAPKVIRTGKPELVAEIPDSLLEVVARDQEHLQIIRELGLKSAMVVPLQARGRVLGAISFASAEYGRLFDEDDLDLAQQLALRAAMAIDNARLFRDRAHIAKILQQSLLPETLPQLPGVEVAGRYRAAGEGVEVGGDFYDVFQIGERRWGMVMGDVCGKGARAAALTSLARYTIRAAAMREPRPSRILTMLNEAILRESSDESFATVAYAMLEPYDGGAHLTVSCGGHPQPIVLRRDGTVETVGRGGSLLGVLADPQLVDETVDLFPGDAVVLYTDGAPEGRSKRGFFGSQRLLGLVRSCVGVGAASIAQTIENEVMEFQNNRPRDDVALLVFRIADNGGPPTGGAPGALLESFEESLRPILPAVDAPPIVPHS